MTERKHAFLFNVKKTKLVNVRELKDVTLESDSNGHLHIKGRCNDESEFYFVKDIDRAKAQPLLKKILEQLNEVHSITIKRWLKFSEAMLYSSMSRRLLNRLMDRNVIYGIRRDDGDFIVDRYSIDEYYERQKTELAERRAALNLG